jgi:protoporphyrinogen oxidase
VTRVVRHGTGFRVETPEGYRDFDRIVSTLPANATARLCPDLDPEIRARLDGVVYQGVMCASLVLDRPLGGYYLTYLTDTNLPFTAIVEMSALVGTARFSGRTLVYLPRYATQKDKFWELNDDAIRDRFTAGLLRVYPDLDPASVSAFRVARVKNVMAVPTLGYTDAAPPVMTNVEGFHVVNSAQITDGTLNVDATLGVLDRALPQLLTADSRKNLKSAA